MCFGGKTAGGKLSRGTCTTVMTYESNFRHILRVQASDAFTVLVMTNLEICDLIYKWRSEASFQAKLLDFVILIREEKHPV